MTRRPTVQFAPERVQCFGCDELVSWSREWEASGCCPSCQSMRLPSWTGELASLLALVLVVWAVATVLA